MSRVILKYALHVTDGGQHAIPHGSFLLDMQMQGDTPAMWWSTPANPGPPDTWPLQTFLTAVTGPPGYTDGLHYIGTFQLGGFVGHVMSQEPVPRSLEEAVHA